MNFSLKNILSRDKVTHSVLGIITQATKQARVKVLTSMNFSADSVEIIIPSAGKDTVTHFVNDQVTKCWLMSVLENADDEFANIDGLKEIQRKIKILIDSLCIFNDVSQDLGYDAIAKCILVSIHTEQETMGSAVFNDCFDKLHFWKVELVESNLITISLIGANDFEDETQSQFTARTRKAKTNIDFKQVGILTYEGLGVLTSEVRSSIPAGYFVWKLDEEQPTRVEINPPSPRSESSSHRKKPTSEGFNNQEQIAAMIAKQVAEQVAKTLADIGSQQRAGGDGTQGAQPMQTDRQVGESIRLRAVEGLFEPDLFMTAGASISTSTRLEAMATSFLAYLNKHHVVLTQHRLWTAAAAKQFVCCEWSIDGIGATIGLHLFHPAARIAGIADFMLACMVWGECEGWLRGAHMSNHILLLSSRLIILSYDEYQIGGCELANAIEVMAMDLRQVQLNGEDLHATPKSRVQRALPIPKSSIAENANLARAIRMAHSSQSRDYTRRMQVSVAGSNAGTQRQVTPYSFKGTNAVVATNKRPKLAIPAPPPMASAPTLRMCYEWITAGEPELTNGVVCPSKRGRTCGWSHSWGTASDPDKELIRTHARRPRP